MLGFNDAQLKDVHVQPHVTVTGVDAHAHVMAGNIEPVPGSHSKPARDVSGEEFAGLLRANDLSHGVLTAPSFLGTDNTLLLSTLAAHPQLRGTVIVDISIEAEQLQIWGRQGVVGIRLNWTKRDAIPDVNTRAYKQLFNKVRQAGMHVELFIEDARMSSVLPSILEQDVPVVIDHFGAPDPNLGIGGPGFKHVLDAVAHRAAWVKLSAPYRLGDTDPRRYVDALLDAGGAQQLMWGSDFPWISHEHYRGGIVYRDTLDWLRDWIPDKATRDVVLRDTPARLFKF